VVFHYESLVGHLFMVNGRTLSAPPPGALVEVAPKKASRGREADTVFVLALPSGRPAAGSFYEEMAAMAAERYFNSSGSVTAGLRAVYDTVNRALLERNRINRDDIELNLICAVLHDKNLILSRCGLGVALVTTDEETVLFPTNPLDSTDVVFGPPLGVRQIPDVKLKQVTVSSGTRMILSDAELGDLGPDRLGPLLRGGDIETVLLNLKDTRLDRATLMAVQFVPPEEDMNPFMPEGDNSKIIAATPLPEEKRIENVTLEPAFGTRVIDTATSARDRTQEGVSAVAKGISRSAEVMNGLIDHYFPDDTTPTWWSGPLRILIAAGSPLVVVGLVITLWLTNLDVSEYDLCVEEMSQNAQIARNISSSDPNGLLAMWNAVLQQVEQCDALRPEGILDADVRAVEREGQNVVDSLLTITRREADVLASFTSARLTQVVLRGLTMYVLDDANDIVYEVQLESNGRSVVSNTQVPIANMRRGASVNQFTMGDIIGITWAEDGSGLSQGNVLLALDRDGVLVEHSPTILTRGAQRLLGTENWVTPVQIKVWRGNLYVLDPGANQIWRYTPTGGSYSSPPTEYFAGERRPNISGAVDFSIDTNGAVYVLLGDGQMGKYLGGEPQTFAYAAFPSGQELGVANAMFLSTSPISQSIYLSSQPNRTVYEVTQAGTFMRSYRTFEEGNFELLEGVIAEPSLQVVYVLSGNSVFVFNKEA
jgi:hypothetical protein